MPTHRVTLEMNKSVMGPTPVIEVRVGDADQIIEATLLDGGLPYKVPEGAKVLFQVKRPDGGLTRSLPFEKGDADNVYKGEIPTQSFIYHGVSKEAFIAVYHGDEPGPTSQTMQLVVLPGTTDEKAVKYFDAMINAISKDLEADVEENKQSFAAAQREREEEFDRTQREQQDTFEKAEKEREDGEAARKAAEEKRDEAEKARASAEELRASEEIARGNAESERDTAEKARATAEESRRSSETDREAAERARADAEQKRAAAEVERGTAETARSDAEDARDAAETEREEAEQGRVDAEAARVGAETDRESAETDRDEAEGKRAQAEAARDAAEETRASAEAARQQEFDTNEAHRQEQYDDAEAARKAAEDARVEAEGKRDSAEQARVEAEDKRASAETERDSAEQARSAAEDERVAADADRAERQTENDNRQAKNDADQAANNLAAQGRLTRILKDGEYDPETRVPTIEGDLTHVFAVPTPEADAAREAVESAKAALAQMADAGGEGPQFDGQLDLASTQLAEAQAVYEASNKYVEWLWLIDEDSQTGYWEQYGSGNTLILDPISTDEYDRMWAGETVETKHVEYANGASYNVSKTKEAIEAAQTAQAKVDSEQDVAIQAAKDAAEAAKTAADNAATGAADALESYRGTQATRDTDQDTDIKAAKDAAAEAKKRADEAYDHLPDVVSGEANGLAPMFGDSTGYLHSDGETAMWQDIPTFDTTRNGLVPKAPDGESKVLLSTGWGDYKGGGMPDYRQLKAVLKEANALKDAAKVGSGDYDFGTRVTDQDSLDAYTGAIATAQAVLDKFEDPETTQQVLDAAEASLDEATETFLAASTEVKPDKSKLTAQETRYTTLKQDVGTSADGKDVTFGSKWVTTEEQTTADNALTTARNAVNAAKKQSDIDSAVSTLTSAFDTYEEAIKTATKDTAALDDALSAADAAKTDVQVSDDEGSDLPEGSKYVTTAEMAALTDAIEAANTAKESATTQGAIDKATSDLTGATSTFTEAIKTNWAPPENISSASWEDIERLSALAAESPQDYSKYLGQTKTIDLSGLGNGCTNVTVMIIGIGQDVDPQGHNLGFTFQLRDGLPYQTFTMNGSNTTTGGWRDSLMRSTNLPKVKAAMPADLRSRLKTMVKKTHITNAFNALIETQDDLALLSQVEVWGENENPNSWGVPKGEGEQYQWYAQHNTNADRIIKRADGSAYFWWLRSVYDTTLFRLVGSGGTLDYSYASGQRLPCACFSV